MHLIQPMKLMNPMIQCCDYSLCSQCCHYSPCSHCCSYSLCSQCCNYSLCSQLSPCSQCSHRSRITVEGTMGVICSNCRSNNCCSSHISCKRSCCSQCCPFSQCSHRGSNNRRSQGVINVTAVTVEAYTVAK